VSIHQRGCPLRLTFLGKGVRHTTQLPPPIHIIPEKHHIDPKNVIRTYCNTPALRCAGQEYPSGVRKCLMVDVVEIRRERAPCGGQRPTWRYVSKTCVLGNIQVQQPCPIVPLWCITRPPSPHPKSALSSRVHTVARGENFLSLYDGS
jgi:hypothetical protein